MADYWPEFAANGKEGVLVRHVLGHTAGLPVFDEPVDDFVLFDWDECCRRLATQPPRWNPGDGSGYHSATQGWLLGELVRRVDGRTLGTFFRDEVARPLGLDLHIGLDDREFTRVADVATFHVRPGAPSDSELLALDQPISARSAALVNTSAWRRAEFPASNGHGNARSIALAMAPLANDGRACDHRLLSPATIERIFEVQADGVDRMTGRHFKLGMGYGLNCEHTPLGVNDRTLWWAGWGGSMCVIDVENRLTVSYVMNRMLEDENLRAVRVIFALLRFYRS
jgi:CubicO group peptidase (beta-lactamase class C family)